MRCDGDCDVLASAETDALLALGYQALDPKSSINGSGEIKAATKSLRGKKAALLANKKSFCGKFCLGSMLRKYCRASFCASSHHFLKAF